MAEGTSGGEGLLFLTDEQLRKGIEAMFFAYRGFTADPDRILEGMDYGRAHHRAVHFIHRSPGTTVGNLLAILGVTKQSLNRVLRKTLKTKGSFPTEEAATKLIFLAIRNFEKGGRAVREWVAARNQLAIMFAGRFDA